MFDFDGFLLFDGAMGTMLQKRGLKTGELPELLNITDIETIISVHKEYVAAGADVITSNTFGANSRKYSGEISPEMVIKAGIKAAKISGAKYVALDIGPTGALLKPLGTMTFEQAYDIFKEQVIAGSEAEADIILIETMSDLREAKAALLAAKENSKLPVFVTMTFSEEGRTFLGTSPKIAALTLSSLGADAVGLNCSLGPAELLPMIKEFVHYSTVPVLVQANAGLPKIVDGENIYTISADEYAQSVEKMMDIGVRVVGGCCGTTPEYIKKIKTLISERKPVYPEIRHLTAFTSGQNSVILNGGTAVIGERINPTGKKLLKEALRNKDYGYIINEALNQQDCGADLLDVNAGLPEIDEKETLVKLVSELQAVTPLPLQIDSSDPVAVEAAVRIYNGKPIINSVNGKEESLDSILPIVKKYGTAVVALTLDEKGIPDTAEGRYLIAEKILRRAVSLGIPESDILVDCLVLTASTNQDTVMETLKGIRLVKERLGLKTVLGVSNVSFGLPDREDINSTFLAAAFSSGLDMPILNPLSEAYMKVVSVFKVLNNEDRGAEKYIARCLSHEKKAETQTAVSQNKIPASSAEADMSDIKNIILKGRKNLAAGTVREMLKKYSPMELINEFFIPALDEVGDKFEKGEYFLPQLMSSAEAVKCGFDVIKEVSGSAVGTAKGPIVLATVKGDIHDIGKNIVKMLLENYGYKVIDLGKDVPPQAVAKAVAENDVKLAGLSALMTTTVKYMEETIKLIKKSSPSCMVMVGGAVLTDEYAKMVGADFYAKDAAESARIAAQIFN